MNRRGKVRTGLTWEIEEGVKVALDVRCRIEPYFGGTLETPPEGGYAYDLEVRNERGCPLPKAMQERLEQDDKFVEAVYESFRDDEYARMSCEGRVP